MLSYNRSNDVYNVIVSCPLRLLVAPLCYICKNYQILTVIRFVNDAKQHIR